MATYASAEQLQQRLHIALAHLAHGPMTREALARVLAISIPTAVRVVRDLRARGYRIASVPHHPGRGWHYVLQEHPDRQAGQLKVLPSPVVRPTDAVLREVQRKEARQRGKIAAIEPISGRIFVGDTIVEAALLGRRACPGAKFYFKRIGHEAVHRRVGGMRRAGPRS